MNPFVLSFILRCFNPIDISPVFDLYLSIMKSLRGTLSNKAKGFISDSFAGIGLYPEVAVV